MTSIQQSSDQPVQPVQSLCCPHEEALCVWLSIECPAKTFTDAQAELRLGRFGCASDSFKIWAAMWQNQQKACAPSEDSDQPVHPPSLIRVLAVRMKKAWVLSYPLSTLWRLIRLGRCPGSSQSSLGAQSFCWFCHAQARLYCLILLQCFWYHLQQSVSCTEGCHREGFTKWKIWQGWLIF